MPISSLKYECHVKKLSRFARHFYRNDNASIYRPKILAILYFSLLSYSLRYTPKLLLQPAIILAYHIFHIEPESHILTLHTDFMHILSPEATMMAKPRIVI